MFKKKILTIVIYILAAMFFLCVFVLAPIMDKQELNTLTNMFVMLGITGLLGAGFCASILHGLKNNSKPELWPIGMLMLVYGVIFWSGGEKFLPWLMFPLACLGFLGGLLIFIQKIIGRIKPKYILCEICGSMIRIDEMYAMFRFMRQIMTAANRRK